MNFPSNTIPSWSTASFGDTADTSPMELSALGAHLNLCKALNGRLFAVRWMAELTHTFVTSRFVTTLVAIGILMGAASLMS